jgi:hypothetical protein
MHLQLLYASRDWEHVTRALALSTWCNIVREGEGFE